MLRQLGFFPQHFPESWTLVWTFTCLSTLGTSCWPYHGQRRPYSTRAKVLHSVQFTPSGHHPGEIAQTVTGDTRFRQIPCFLSISIARGLSCSLDKRLLQFEPGHQIRCHPSYAKERFDRPPFHCPIAHTAECVLSRTGRLVR